MRELDNELWKLGIFAKTEHNEVAPAQHELAPIFSTTNIATDHNQLTMEMMKKVATRHGLVCLLHEKPFESINGSGKHNNWSLSTNTGKNLLEPGDTPHQNAQFLTFLCAVIQAVDEYQDMLRASVASAGNDHRLGGNEAPPAIVSIFLGEELTEILESIEKNEQYDSKEQSIMRIGVHTMPKFPRDTTDRNRTSPFAFTGNKFEFRMLGSSHSISGPNIVINTAVAEILSRYADYLETTPGDFNDNLHNLIRKTIKEHKRIIFNGNGYDNSWVEEAEKRGLLNLKATPESIGAFVNPKNIELFTKHKVFTEAEMKARFEIHLQSYNKIINIEALTMLDMSKMQILPAVIEYSKEISDTINSKRAVNSKINTTAEEKLLEKISDLTAKLYEDIEVLQENVNNAESFNDVEKLAFFSKDNILVSMNNLRKTADMLETITDKKYWPFPSTGDIIFSIK